MKLHQTEKIDNGTGYDESSGIEARASESRIKTIPLRTWKKLLHRKFI